MFAGRGRLQPLLDQSLSGPGNGVSAGFQRRRDLTVAPAFALVRGVGFQQNARHQQLPGWVFSGLDQADELCTLLIAEGDDIFLHGGLVAGHESDSVFGIGISSQRLAAEPMTETTSTPRRKFELLLGLSQATRGFPFMVQRNGFAMVALK